MRFPTNERNGQMWVNWVGDGLIDELDGFANFDSAGLLRGGLFDNSLIGLL